MRLQGRDAPPSGCARTRLAGGTYTAGKIKFQIWHLFILVPKFYFLLYINIPFLPTKWPYNYLLIKYDVSQYRILTQHQNTKHPPQTFVRIYDAPLITPPRQRHVERSAARRDNRQAAEAARRFRR